MNLKRIKKGTTWVLEIKFWEDEEMTVPIDVTGHTFEFTAFNSVGAVITLDNDDLEVQDDNHRKATVSAEDTSAYAVQELRWELNVTLPDATVEEWDCGYINVVL
jgi:hypothetical protein